VTYQRQPDRRNFPPGRLYERACQGWSGRRANVGGGGRIERDVATALPRRARNQAACRDMRVPRSSKGMEQPVLGQLARGSPADRGHRPRDPSNSENPGELACTFNTTDLPCLHYLGATAWPCCSTTTCHPYRVVEQVEQWSRLEPVRHLAPPLLHLTLGRWSRHYQAHLSSICPAQHTCASGGFRPSALRPLRPRFAATS
jgi:hypothetical protein